MNLPKQPFVGDRYQLQNLLGKGGMGDVYRAYDQQAQQSVAIKALKPEIVEDAPDLVERFTREGQALRQLHHPNIVGILDYVNQDNQHYLVMEYIPGGSLRDRLQQHGALPLGDVLEITLDLADALTRTHRMGIVHRDIKPDNVMLAEDGTPRLTDFGVASIAGRTRVTETGALVGTFAYLSPEACRGEHIDERTDIWSFGVMLYELLAGYNPFRKDMAAATITAILNDPLPPLPETRPEIPEQLSALIFQMAEKDISARINSVRLVGAQVEAIIRDLETPVRASLGSVAEKVQAGPSSRFATPPESKAEVVRPAAQVLAEQNTVDGSIVTEPYTATARETQAPLYRGNPNSWLYVHEDEKGNTEVHVGRFIHVVETAGGDKDIHFGFVSAQDNQQREPLMFGLKGPPIVVGIVLLLLLGMCLTSCFALGLLLT
ncbi:MAG: serine/threonine protein kinase [Anaerolineales bacterium]